MVNFMTVDDVSNEEIETLMADADRFREGVFWRPAKQTFSAHLFFENSSRTRFSFEVAAKKLGLEALNFQKAGSSVNKGESLYDTVRMFEEMGADVAIIRHPERRFYEKLQNGIEIPLINAGDGTGEHPTQSLLDYYTIRSHFGTLNGRTIAMIGDICHSRVAHSNTRLFQRFGARVVFSGPEKWMEMPDEADIEVLPIDEAVEEADVVMMLRIQRERHRRTSSETDYLHRYGLTEQRAARMKKEAIIMHPAPVNRGVEIADRLVESPRSHIFRQMKYGVYVRMAVLKRVLEEKEGAGSGAFAQKREVLR